jgi:hypothetical protein
MTGAEIVAHGITHIVTMLFIIGGYVMLLCLILSDGWRDRQ